MQIYSYGFLKSPTVQTGTQEEFSSVQTQPSAQELEKAVSSVRTAPCRQEKATSPTVKSVLVETGEAEQLSRLFTRGCRGKKTKKQQHKKHKGCAQRQRSAVSGLPGLNCASPRSYRPFNLEDNHRTRRSYMRFGEGEETRRANKKHRDAADFRSKGETLHLSPRKSGSLIQPCRLFSPLQGTHHLCGWSGALGAPPHQICRALCLT